MAHGAGDRDAHGPLPPLPHDTHPLTQKLPHVHVQHARRVLPRHANGPIHGGRQGAAAIARAAARPRAKQRLHHATNGHAAGRAPRQRCHHQAAVRQHRQREGLAEPRRAHVAARAAVASRAVASQRRDDPRGEVHRPKAVIVAVADHQPPAPHRNALGQIQPRRDRRAAVSAAAARAGAVHPRLHQPCRAGRGKGERLSEQQRSHAAISPTGRTHPS
jgi:hypothetical protein